MAGLCFDMYGTLCDTSSVRTRLGEALDVPERLVAAVDETWRRKQLQYSYQSAQMDDYEPFWEITGHALDYALAAYDLDPTPDTRERIRSAYDRLDPFPGAVEALTRLGEAGHDVVVLSNGNPAMLERLAENAGLAPHLDGVLSADAVRTFKPDPAVYEHAAETLDRPLDDCRLISSNAWDVAGAGNAGMATTWVNRTRDPPESIGATPGRIADTLPAVADDLC
ncbi:haloacid dehalogenase type II [Haloplanus natans]|uniref:haloacid dehalogenase type II n=1 Tax=Haloplanus natans TaxID=376171 RepID=UPI0006777A84|nr:haloacid dehalogenase type II [Haloplanus natans]